MTNRQAKMDKIRMLRFFVQPKERANVTIERIKRINPTRACEIKIGPEFSICEMIAPNENAMAGAVPVVMNRFVVSPNHP
jgi:hypothetical protein